MGKRITKVEPVTLSEVKEILSASQRDGELLYEQSIALDHATKFAKLPADDARALVKELEDLGISPEVAVRLTDILSKSRVEIRMLFSKERFSSNPEEIQKIIAVIEKYGER